MNKNCVLVNKLTDRSSELCGSGARWLHSAWIVCVAFLAVYLAPQLIVANTGVSIPVNLGEYATVESAKLDAQKTEREATQAREDCKEAKKKLETLMKDIQKECGELGMKACIPASAECEESESNRGGGGIGALAQMFGGLAGSFMGSSFMGTPMSSQSQMCRKTRKGIEEWKKAQRESQKDAKDSLKDAEKALEAIQAEANDLTDEKSNANKEYLSVISEMKKMNAELPQNVRAARDQITAHASQLHLQIREAVAKQANTLKERTQAQSALTRLYTKYMGGCVDKLTGQKLENDAEVAQMMTELRKEMATIQDLRQRERKKLDFKAYLKQTLMMREKTARFSYDQCVQQAKISYDYEHTELTAKIKETDLGLAALADFIEQGEQQLKEMPERLREQKELIEKEAERNRTDATNQLAILNASLMEKANNYNQRLVQAQNRMRQSQSEFMMKSQAYEASQTVMEASLGNVGPLRSQIKAATCEVAEICNKEDEIKKGAKNAKSSYRKTKKTPSYCGDVSDDDDVDFIIDQSR